MYLKPGWRVCVVGPASFSMTARLHSSPVGTEGCFPICNLIRIHTPTHTLAGSPWGRTHSVASSSCHNACGHTVAAVPFNIQYPSSRKPLPAGCARSCLVLGASPVSSCSSQGAQFLACVKILLAPCSLWRRVMGVFVLPRLANGHPYGAGSIFFGFRGNWNPISV